MFYLFGKILFWILLALASGIAIAWWFWARKINGEDVANNHKKAIQNVDGLDSTLNQYESQLAEQHNQKDIKLEEISMLKQQLQESDNSLNDEKILIHKEITDLEQDIASTSKKLKQCQNDTLKLKTTLLELQQTDSSLLAEPDRINVQLQELQTKLEICEAKTSKLRNKKVQLESQMKIGISN